MSRSWISSWCFVVALGFFAQLSPARAQTPLGDWLLADIGPAVTESATFQDGCFRIKSTGGDLGQTSDNATFVFANIEVDAAIELRLTELVSASTRSAAVSVQFRENLEPGSRFVALGVLPLIRLQPIVQYRDLTNGLGETLAGNSWDFFDWPELPSVWLRVERRGSTFTALWSRDGKRWHLEGEYTFSEPFDLPLLAGMAVSGGRLPIAMTACDLKAVDRNALFLQPAFSTDAANALVGQAITFDANATVPGASKIVRYQWNFGDGGTAEGAVVSHTFAQEGNSLVQLTITDEGGLSVVMARDLRVLKTMGNWKAIDLGGAHRERWEVDGACHRLTVGGSDAIYRFDQVSLIFQEIRGDFTAQAQITRAEGVLAFAALGLMARESFGERARHAFSTVFSDLLTLGSLEMSFAFTWRPVDEAKEGLALVDGEQSLRPELPGAWLRMERQESTLIGSFSNDGVEWLESGRHTFDPPLKEELLVGMASAVHCFQGICTEVDYCNVEIEQDVPPPLPRFRRGDVDQNGRVNLADAVGVMLRLFQSAPAPACEDAADVNDSGNLNITDAVYLMNHLFRGGPAPAPPGAEECGIDPGEVDGLAECVYSACT